jgi:F0F1-type ATP synthase membrane subunit b/b'
MFAFFYNAVVLLLAASGGSGQGGFTEFYNKYLNYPGFELWKFINLAIFIGVMVYVAKRPLSEAFKAKRDAIRAELIRAEQEKQAALARLTSAEAKLASLEAEKAALLQKAREEADAEKRRLAEQTEWEVSKLHEQTAGEVARLRNQTFAQLRRFSAEESVRLAEERLKAQLDTQKDSQLVKAGIASIGGLN